MTKIWLSLSGRGTMPVFDDIDHIACIGLSQEAVDILDSPEWAWAKKMSSCYSYDVGAEDVARVCIVSKDQWKLMYFCLMAGVEAQRYFTDNVTTVCQFVFDPFMVDTNIAIEDNKFLPAYIYRLGDRTFYKSRRDIPAEALEEFKECVKKAVGDSQEVLYAVNGGSATGMNTFDMNIAKSHMPTNQEELEELFTSQRI